MIEGEGRERRKEGRKECDRLINGNEGENEEVRETNIMDDWKSNREK